VRPSGRALTSNSLRLWAGPAQGGHPKTRQHLTPSSRARRTLAGSISHWDLDLHIRKPANWSACSPEKGSARTDLQKARHGLQSANGCSINSILCVCYSNKTADYQVSSIRPYWGLLRTECGERHFLGTERGWG